MLCTEADLALYRCQIQRLSECGDNSECQLDEQVGVKWKNNDEAVSDMKKGETKKRRREEEKSRLKHRRKEETGMAAGRKQAPKCGSGYSCFCLTALCSVSIY